MSNTLYLFIVRVVGYVHTRNVHIIAADAAEAENLARAQNPGGVAYVAHEAQ